MKTYLNYKNKIQGFTNVSETVKIVEKIAASSLHFLENEVEHLKLYISDIEQTLSRLVQYYQPHNHPLLQTQHTGNKILIIITGNKGLVGGLWHTMVNTATTDYFNYNELLTIGTKGKRYLEEEQITIKQSFNYTNNIPQKEDYRQLINYLFTAFKKGTFSQVDILYPQFLSLAKQRPTLISFLPFTFSKHLEEQNKTLIPKPLGLPIFEPSKKLFFNNLFQKYIEIFFHSIMLETKLSEISARTVAMEHASITTENIIQKTTAYYLKQRRLIETQKQLESFSIHKHI